ncbi:isopentenyl transferase family protein [Streptomyces aureocirculatus]|uniref:isopentenyl transferase family protein n=1 Tax=Streptomyces aureocirculatus TaxID=67275 RepID=UPI00068D60E8|nr:isopentenyl transferase family protein [Streptomyces aureocirculatus]
MRVLQAAGAALNPRLHLVLGPTGIGKTHRAVAAAIDSRCPVIALDRIQCHPELTTGSGRPLARDLAGTTRLYLDKRPLSHGPIAARPAVDRLVDAARRLLRGGATTLILEGGSNSILRELAQRTDWCEGWTLDVTAYVEGNPRRYEAAVARRVEQMVGYRTGSADTRTLQEELADVSDDPSARKHLAEVIGFREAIELCEQHSLTPLELTGPPGHLWRYELSERIRCAHLAYARQQRHAIATALPALHDLAEGVELCES